MRGVLVLEEVLILGEIRYIVLRAYSHGARVTSEKRYHVSIAAGLGMELNLDAACPLSLGVRSSTGDNVN